MKIRKLTETQARRSWDRIIDLQLRGYTFVINRRGRPVAWLRRIQPTISSGRKGKLN
jgi:hypothetical protein